MAAGQADENHWDEWDIYGKEYMQQIQPWIH